MKYNVKAALLTTLFATFVWSLSSCKKEEKEDEGLLPKISFVTDQGYTSQDVVLAPNTDFKIGIKASKSEEKDVLTKFTVTQKIDGRADATIVNNNLSGSEGDNYSYDYSGKTMDHAGNEQYIFTVVNRDGLINKVSLMITVQ